MIKGENLLLTVLLQFILMSTAFSQMNVQCSGNDMHSIYVCTQFAFYRIDSVDISPSAPKYFCANTMGVGGVAITNNILTGLPTLYFAGSSSFYQYWSNSYWWNTNHSTVVSASNPGGTIDHIYSLSSNGYVSKYDGTGNATVILNGLNVSGAAVYDVAGDNQGNFYLFFTNAQKIIAYNPSGIPIDSFTTTGYTTAASAGFAILGNRFYAADGSALYEGIKTGNNVNFNFIAAFNINIDDIATCPQAANPLAISNPDKPYFSVYPNPASDNAAFKLNNVESLEISDCLGVLKQEIKTQALNEYHLKVKGWKPGVYFIKVISKNKSFSYISLLVV